MRPNEFWQLSVWDYSIMEAGYWDAQADAQEWQAWHTLHQVSVMSDGKQQLTVADFMPVWAKQWKGYQTDITKKELDEVMANAVAMTKQLNSAHSNGQ